MARGVKRSSKGSAKVQSKDSPRALKDVDTALLQAGIRAEELGGFGAGAEGGGIPLHASINQPVASYAPSAIEHPPLVLPNQLTAHAGQSAYLGDPWGQTPPQMMYPTLNHPPDINSFLSVSANEMARNGVSAPNAFLVRGELEMMGLLPSGPAKVETSFAAPQPTTTGGSVLSAGGSITSSNEEMHKMLKDAAAKDVQKLLEKEKNEEEQKRGEEGGGKRSKPDLEPEEKARQNRERNRAHARSTRLRKKAYVNLLSDEVTRLTQERELREQEAKIMKERAEEGFKVRKWVLRTFFDLHAGGETDVGRWNAILAPEFTFVQPITPFRSFDRHQTMYSGNVRVVMGTDEMVDDSVSLKVMLQNLGVHNPRWLHKRLNIFTGKNPAFIERLKNEKVVSKGESGANALQVSKSSSSSATTVPPPDEGSSSNKASASSSASSEGDGEGATAADTISDTSSSSVHQHDYNAPSIPDPPATGKKKSQAQNSKGSNPSIVSLGSESNNSSVVPQKSQLAPSAGAGTAAEIAPPPPPKSSVAPSHPPLPKENSLELRLARAPVVNLPAFQGLGKKAAVPTPSFAAPAAPPSSDGTRDSSKNDGSGSDNDGGSGEDRERNSQLIVRSYEPSLNVSVTSSNRSINSVNKDECTARGEIIAEYIVNETDIFCCAEGFMCKWSLKSINAEDLGAATELEVHGMAKCTFDSSQRLKNVDMMYDVMSVMQQLKFLDHASEDNTAANHMVPNTLDMALSISNEPRLICTLSDPHQITHVNETWMKLWDLTNRECEGKTLLEMLTMHYNMDDENNVNAKFEKKSLKRLKEMIEKATKNYSTCDTIIHYKRSGWTTVTFLNFVPMPDKKYGSNYFLVVARQLNRDDVMESYDALEKMLE